MFKKYKRTNVMEMRKVEQYEDMFGFDPKDNISVSYADSRNGSPKLGDMVARNPDNHNDQWLVAKAYFEKNYEVVEGDEE